MQVAATPMPIWRALAVSSAIGTPVVVSTYIIINKILLPKQGKGVLWYTTTISDPSFSNPDPLKFARPSNQIRQTNQSNSPDPSIKFAGPINQFCQDHQFIRTINFVRTINLVRPCSKFCKPIRKLLSKLWIHLFNFRIRSKIFNLGLGSA
jgi:hypothetical protein